MLFLRLTFPAAGQVYFDGENDLISYPYESSYSIGTNSFSVMAWINAEDVTANSYVMGNYDNGAVWWLLNLYEGDVRFYVDDGTVNLGTAYAISTNTLYHIAGTWDGPGNHMSFYVNGLLRDEVTSARGNLHKEYPIEIGGRSIDVTRQFKGTVTDARFYSRELTAAEIECIYKRPWTLTDAPSLVLRGCVNGRFNYGYAIDTSINNLTATNHGMELYESLDGWTGSIDPGSNQYMDVSPFEGPTNGLLSISCWFYPKSGCDGYICAKRSNTDFDWVAYYYGANFLQCGIGDGSAWGCYKNSDTVPPNQWHHLLFTYNDHSPATNYNVYLNGELSTSTTASVALDDSNELLVIGARQSTGNTRAYNFDGMLRDLRIYNRELTAADASNLFLNISITNTPIGHWSMQPAFQNTDSKLIGTARNYGSGPDGKYSNAPSAAPWVIQLSPPLRTSFCPSYTSNLVMDISGHLSTATNLGAELIDTSEGWTARFDGTNDYIATGIIPNATQKTSVIRFSIQSYTTAERNLMGIYQGNRWYILLSHSAFPNKMLIGSYNIYAQIDETNIPLHEKVQLAICADGTNITAYLNDSILTQYVANPAPFTLPVFIGAQSRTTGADHFAACTIYDFSHYTNALSVNDVSNLYHRVPISYRPAASYSMQPKILE